MMATWAAEVSLLNGNRWIVTKRVVSVEATKSGTAAMRAIAGVIATLPPRTRVMQVVVNVRRLRVEKPEEIG